MPAQVACVIDGSEPPRLVTVLTDAARTAVRNGELQLTGCAFGSGAGVRATVAQLARIVKYVGRGFRLPAGPLAPMPSTAREEAVARAPRQRGPTPLPQYARAPGRSPAPTHADSRTRVHAYRTGLRTCPAA